jgi:hypothetical protein
MGMQGTIKQLAERTLVYQETADTLYHDWQSYEHARYGPEKVEDKLLFECAEHLFCPSPKFGDLVSHLTTAATTGWMFPPIAVPLCSADLSDFFVLCCPALFVCQAAFVCFACGSRCSVNRRTEYHATVN